MAAPRSLKVLFLTGFLGRGGSERQLYLLLRHLDPRQFERHILVFNPSPNSTYEGLLNRHGVRIWQMPAGHKSVPRRMIYLWWLLRRLQPDIVHAWTFHHNAYAGIVGRLAGTPLRWGVLRNSLYAREIGQLPRVLRFFSLRTVQRILVNAVALRDELIAGGLPARKIMVLPNCVLPPEKVPPADLREFGVAAAAPVVGIIGNLRHQKNHLLFVAVMAAVIAEQPAARGVIVGQPLPRNPGVAAAITTAIEAYGLTGKVIMIGFREDILALMARFDVVILTSHYEGMPNVIMEAMVAGCPVVATEVGGVRELVRPDVDGFIAPAGDARALSDAVNRLLCEPELAQRLGASGRQRMLARFDCAEQARRLARAYQDALKFAPAEEDDGLSD